MSETSAGSNNEVFRLRSSMQVHEASWLAKLMVLAVLEQESLGKSQWQVEM